MNYAFIVPTTTPGIYRDGRECERRRSADFILLMIICFMYVIHILVFIIHGTPTTVNFDISFHILYGIDSFTHLLTMHISSCVYNVYLSIDPPSYFMLGLCYWFCNMEQHFMFGDKICSNSKNICFIILSREYIPFSSASLITHLHVIVVTY